MQKQIDELLEKMSDKVANLVLQKLAVRLDEFKNAPPKITYTEKEAADFLGVSVDTLQRWRKENLINYCHYPAARRNDKNETGLSSIYSYDLNDLLEFRGQYKRIKSRKADG